MIRLQKTLEAMHSDQISRVLKREIEMLGQGILPLHLGTQHGGMVDDGNITVTVNKVSSSEKELTASVGIFFNEIVGGCSCGDDPVTQNAYCELLVEVEVTTGKARFSLL